jgi:hypothetical protein
MFNDKSSTAGKLIRACLRLDVADGITGATKRQLGFFGFFDPRRRSLQDSALEAFTFCLAILMFVCLIVLLIYAFVYMQFFEELLTGPGVKENWWEVSSRHNNCVMRSV